MKPKSFRDIYKNKSVLITGNTGFKGSWLSAWLLELGAKVHGFSFDVPTKPSHFEAALLNDKIQHNTADIRNLAKITNIYNSIKPDFVFHLAAQPLVRLSYEQPLQTLETNVQGTTNILEALRLGDFPCNAVFITSDKCYDNVEWTWGYRETDTLGGKDPYSASKGAAELAIKTYACSFFKNPMSKVKVAVGRAGNVIGGGDWAVDRIVPDCMRSWSGGKIVEIRNPGATRPWQHVLEPLSGYLILGGKLAQQPEINGEPFNFGPPANQNHSVKDLIEEMRNYWNQIQWEDVSKKQDHLHEAGLLKLCCDKAHHQLNWEPVLNFQETVKYTVDWYRYYYEHSQENILDFTLNQIKEYETIAKKRGLPWTE